MNLSEELAWAAGLFEGEGCFAMSRYRDTPHLRARMIMTDEQPLRRFWDAVCYGTFTGPHKRPSHKPHWKPYWVWNATGDAVICVFALLEPHLGDRRKARFYELWDERRAYERTRGHGQLALFPRFRLFERMGQVVAYLERVEAYRATGGLTEA